ncbi:hypothetical protein ABWL24_02370 [Priestia megaterium]|uniref:hypothetical protein n=1 Tax=Priestia megaterium TaxID=1404 RepID=UPI003398BB31
MRISAGVGVAITPNDQFVAQLTGFVMDRLNCQKSEGRESEALQINLGCYYSTVAQW